MLAECKYVPYVDMTIKYITVEIKIICINMRRINVKFCATEFFNYLLLLDISRNLFSEDKLIHTHTYIHTPIDKTLTLRRSLTTEAFYVDEFYIYSQSRKHRNIVISSI